MDGQIQNKQDTSNLVTSAGYNNATNSDTQYPSVKAVNDVITKEKAALTEDITSIETDLTNHKNMIITSEEYSQEESFDEEHYPSVNAVKTAIENATSGLKTEINIDSKQEKSNLVKSESYEQEEDESETKYPSVKAVKSAITTATDELNGEFDTQIQSVEASVTAVGQQVNSVQAGLDGKIPVPTENCTNGTNKCVLTVDGNKGYAWEPIQRAENEMESE